MDFKNIRVHKTSQNEGFEELCCQLYSLQPPQDNAIWVRKRGDGGDGGVEGFWTLPNGDEHCLQTKYFFDFGTAQKNQMKKSVASMLEAHPNCTKYIFAIPFDLTGKKSGKGISQHEHWEALVQEWISDAAPRNIDFELWDCSKLITILSIDDPNFSGRRQYWFNEKCLSQDWINKRVREAIQNLGGRYTPEMHVDLPLSSKLKAFIKTPSFWEDMADLPKLPSAHISDQDIQKLINEVTEKAQIALDQILFAYKYKRLTPEIELAKANVEEAIEKIDPSLESADGKIYSVLSRLRHETIAIIEHLDEVGIKYANTNTIGLFGEAGTGKSHILADLASYAIEQNQPAILLLGQQFKSGQPINFCKNSLDWTDDFENLLGALDAAAQAKDCKSLFAIDALNEGNGKSIWPDELAGFIARVSHFEHIGLVVSCRSNYRKRIFKNVDVDQFTEMQHYGFYGYEEQAAKKYMDERGIARPEAPFLDPEFSNPLFLKTICDTVIRNEIPFPKGLRGITNIFNFYKNSIAETIHERLDLDPAQKLVFKVINTLIDKFISDGNDYVERDVAQQLVDKILPSNGDAERNLVTQLLSEGLLTDDIAYSGRDDNEGVEIIRFSYERYLDYFRAQHFLSTNCVRTNIESVFNKGGAFWNQLDTKLQLDSGFIEALSVLVPELYGKELYGLVELDDSDEKKHSLEFLLKDNFQKSLYWRDPSKTNEDTLNHLNDVLGGLSSKGFEVMVRCATEPKHLFNADLLHRNLKKMSMAERDSLWSIWCAKEWNSTDDYGSNSPIWVLISWALSADIKQVDDERLYLACLALSWFLTSPKRELRDKATKAIVSIIGNNINLTRQLLLSFHDVNDPYVLERVLLCAYAVAIETGGSEIAPLVKTIINRFVRSKNHCEHILMRDYISGVLILGEKYKCLPRNFKLNDFRFKNSENFPLKIPGVNKIEKLKDELSSVYFSVMSDDFGTYTMKRIFDFSPTLLSKTKPETGDHTVSKFLDLIYSKNENFKEIADRYFSAKKDKGHYDNMKMLIDGERSGLAIFGQSSSEIDLEELKNNYDHEKHNEITTLYEKTNKQFYSSMNTEEREEWRWLQGYLGSKRFTKFSRRKAKRWIIDKVKEMGWEKNLFEDFEKNYCYDRNRTSHEVERIGKKYQWIAYHQFLAILANNYFFFDWKGDYKACDGAWDLNCRNIDPTLLHSGKQSKIYNRDIWWLDSILDISQKMDVEKVEAWIKDKSDLPVDFEGLAKIEPESGNQFFVLNASQDATSARHDHNSPYRRISKSISAVIVKKKDINSIVNSLKGKMLYDEFTTRNEYISGAFIGEYPWHPCWDVNAESFYIPRPDKNQFPRPIHYPMYHYFWDGEYDKSIESPVSIDIPSPLLLEGLDLKFNRKMYGFISSNDEMVFFNPALGTNKNPCSAILASHIKPFLEENNYILLWLISTRKQFVDTRSEKYLGESSDFQLCWMDGKKFNGKRWSMFTDMGPKHSILRKVKTISS